MIQAMTSERKIQTVCGNLRRILNAGVDYAIYKNGDYKIKVRMRDCPLAYVYTFSGYMVKTKFSRDLTKYILSYLNTKFICDICV